MDMPTASPAVHPHLDTLRALPFLEEVQFSEAHGEKDVGVDGILTIRPLRKTHVFFVQQKRSYLDLDRSLLYAVIAPTKSEARVHLAQWP